MNQHDLILVLQEENMPADMIYERFLEVFSFLDILYLIVTRIIRQMNWNTPEEKSQDSR
jgi:hypothetical protein